MYNIELDEYEVANLREGLEFIRACGGDTGDWLGQVLNKLPHVDMAPNKTVQDQQRMLALLVGWKLLF